MAQFIRVQRFRRRGMCCQATSRHQVQIVIKKEKKVHIVKMALSFSGEVSVGERQNQEES